MNVNQPIIAVVGPTASGKTAIGARIAEIYGGEVISADSMQIYKGLDITSAKPQSDEMRGIPHHLISVIEMGQPFCVADYVRLARDKITDVASRGKIPVIVGGTGLYISSIMDNINFDTAYTDSTVRERLTRECREYGAQQLLDRLFEVDPETAVKLPAGNKSRIIRALEVFELTGIPISKHKELSRADEPLKNICMLQPNFTDRNDLYERINRRVDIMLEKGMLDECRLVYENCRTATSGQAIGYKELIPFFKGEDTIDNCIGKIKQLSRHYAKRQMTWFRRDNRINLIEIDNIMNFDKIIKNCEKTVANSKVLCYNNNCM